MGESHQGGALFQDSIIAWKHHKPGGVKCYMISVYYKTSKMLG